MGNSEVGTACDKDSDDVTDGSASDDADGGIDEGCLKKLGSNLKMSEADRSLSTRVE